MAKKWIIEEKDIRLSASVEFHAEICSKKENVIGGGWWEMDNHNKILYLYNITVTKNIISLGHHSQEWYHAWAWGRIRGFLFRVGI